MKTLVLWRHGRTSWNAAGRAQGHADIPLDETGHTQALAAASRLAELPLAAIWTSDLGRTVETAGYLERATGLVAVLDKRLREYDMGERQGLTIPEATERYGSGVITELDLQERRIVPGAEITADVRERLNPALEEMLASLDPGGAGVVVTHGAALKIGLAGLLGWPVDQAQSLRGIDNCGWAIVTESGSGQRRLAAYNRVA